MTSLFAKCSRNAWRLFIPGDNSAAVGVTVLRSVRLIDGVADEVRESSIAFDETGVLALDDAAAAFAAGAHATVVDLGGLLVAPGLIDLHGDAFERALMPRGGVFASMEIALHDNRAQLAASGIATSYLSATDSWEPGLRSRETLRSLVEHLGHDQNGPDVRLHVRRETTKTDDFDELCTWVRTGAVSMISFADHTPGGIADVADAPSATQLARSGLSADEMRVLVDAAVARRGKGTSQDEALSRTAVEHNCPAASHDGNSLDDVRRDVRLQVTIAEFPTTIGVAQAYRDAGMTVLFGAPNLVRGGSHLGNLSVVDAVTPAAGDVLSSDYHYPSLLQAPFAAAKAGLCSLATAWKMVSASPADAAGLTDRGRLVAGQRADIVVVDDRADAARAVQLFVAGQNVYQVAWTAAN